MIKLQKSQRLHHRIIQIQLQLKWKILNMAKKHLQKDVCLQKKKTENYR